MKSRRKIIQVGISPIPPFAFRTPKRSFEGFEIDLWEKIAEKLQVPFAYKTLSLKSLLTRLEKGTIDVGFGGITRTQEREGKFNFSHFTLRSQTGILMRTRPHVHLFRSLMTFLKKEGKSLLVYVVLFGLFFVSVAHLTWILERGAGTFSSVYAKGISDTYWWLIVTLSTVGYGDFVPVTIAGRWVGVFVMVFGYLIFGLFIAKLSSLLTLRHLKSDIEKISDLESKTVATKKFSVYENMLKHVGAHVVVVDDIENAYKLLDAGKVSAVLFDAPTLMFHKQKDVEDRFTLIRDIVHEQTYGFTFPNKSAWREKVNEVILQLYESGEYEEIYKRWFGKK